ncbi:MAG: DUF2357 domain-containing protein [Butyrivibrio sp.]
MDNITHDIYERYHEDFLEKIKDDRFYQYYYNLLETGTMYSKFRNRKLIKEVDEEWVEAIEKALPHIHFVIDNPRTFIEEHREIVNIASAKKFTPEAIKHLSQHSEMVDKVNLDGSVEPNKVMDIQKEESYNTYENRFVNTLIKELQRFVNERADIIFERSKDEDGVLLELDSNIDNYNEVITYKLEMRIREKQTDLSSDEDNLNIFNRISRIHKDVNNIAGSKYALDMMGYPLVKHPVVKTNAIAKNVHYKECYDLWNFIHAYDRAGYAVKIIEQDPIINKKFEDDIYNSLLMDFVMLREHMYYKDTINISRRLRPKEVSVSLIRQFMQEVVNEYDMPESDLKQLILVEFTKAQKEKNEILQKADEILKEIKNKRGKNIQYSEEEQWNEFTMAASKDNQSNADAQKAPAAKNTKREKQRLKKEKDLQRRKEIREKEQQLEEQRRQKRLEEEKRRIEEEQQQAAMALEEAEEKKSIFKIFRKKK